MEEFYVGIVGTSKSIIDENIAYEALVKSIETIKKKYLESLERNLLL